MFKFVHNYPECHHKSKLVSKQCLSYSKDKWDADL